MLCEICQKNEATVHIKELRNNEVRLLHICFECAAKREKEGGIQALGFNLAEVLFNIGQSIEKAAGKKEKTSAPMAEKLTCHACGWTSEKLQHSGGRMGCSECYKAFGALIQDALDRVQFGTVHLGKRPCRQNHTATISLKYELEKHQQELAELIKREEYEAAAVCRDKILQLKAEIAAAEKQPEAADE